jgi:hypothetical protein
VGDYVTGSVGGGNNTVGRDDGLINADTGGFNETGDFSDVGYVEDYAIPEEDYIDENLYPDIEVVQGPGTGLGVDVGKGYSEVYEIPYTKSTDTPLTDGTDTVGATAYQDPNTGGNAPGYPGQFVTGSAGSAGEGKGALEEYVIGDQIASGANYSGGDVTGGYGVTTGGNADGIAVGSSVGDPSLVGSPGWEVYTIPTSPQTDDGVGGPGYIDPNTGAGAPGANTDWVVGAPGSSNAGKGAVESYIIKGLTVVDPNTGGNMPGYQGDYVTNIGDALDESGQPITTLVNMTEEFLGDNNSAAKITVTEPSTTTTSVVATSIATRAKQ